MADRRPMAFMSYAHIDDRLNRGYLTEFCECLSGEVCLHLGEEFPIFMDRKNIKWGDSWKKRIEESIDGTTFFIPIISPGFFKSQFCRNELTLFLERERKLERDDLILPIYLIDTPLLNDKIKKNQDKLAQTIASRQYADWRGLRFEDLGSGAVRRALAELAAHIRNALDSIPPSSKDNDPNVETTAPVHHETRPNTDAIERESDRRKPIPEMPIVVVDQMHRGNFTTISQAIKEADPGSRILVHSGIYDEGLILDKALEIVGDGNLGDVVVRAEGRNVVLFKAARGKIANLVLKQIGEEKSYGASFDLAAFWASLFLGRFAQTDKYCININQGVLELVECEIFGISTGCVAIGGKASPKIRGNKIHGGKIGIYVNNKGQALVEDNDIFGNAFSAIAIAGKACNPTIRHNKIHDGNAGIGIIRGQGLIEDNDIFGNVSEGITIHGAGNPTILGNKIHEGKSSGISGANLPFPMEGNKIQKDKKYEIFLSEKGQGLIEDNDIFGNAYNGIIIFDSWSPIVRGNRINKNTYYAISIQNKGAGFIENNDLRDNQRGAWNISDDSKDLVKRSGNQE